MEKTSTAHGSRQKRLKDASNWSQLLFIQNIKTKTLEKTTKEKLVQKYQTN